MVKEAAEKLGELAGPAAAAADSCRENPDSKLFEMMKKKALCILSPHHDQPLACQRRLPGCVEGGSSDSGP
jgi:hypothetical protein